MTNQNQIVRPPEDKEPALDFDFPFVAKVVAMMLFSPESLGDNFEELKPAYFENPVFRDLATIAQNFHKRYHRALTSDEVIAEVEKAIKSNRSLKGAEEEYWKFVQDVLEAAGTDYRYVADRTAEFIRSQVWRKAILDTSKDISNAHSRGKSPDYEKFLQRFQAAYGSLTSSQELVTIDTDSIEPVETTWLWPERIPLGKLTLIVGDPESGKSLFTMWAAAHVSTGAQWPDHCKPPIGRVLVLQCEDGPSDTMVPRLVQYGADRSKVTYVPGVKTAEGEERSFTLLQDIDKLKKEIQRRGDVKLVILDPLQSYFGGALSGKVNLNADAHVRAVLNPLKAMAEETGVAVVGVAHLNKASQTDMIYRIGGSIGIMALARSVWLIKWDRDPDGLRYFQSMKSNRKAGVPGLAFKIAKNGGDVTFEDVPVPTAQELLSSTFAETGAMDAQAWLRGQLATGAKYAKDLFESGEMEGFSRGMLHRAKKALGIEARKVGNFGRGARWEWYRPEMEEKG